MDSKIIILYINESHPDDTANVILLNDDVSEIRDVHVRLQEQLEKHKYTYIYMNI